MGTNSEEEDIEMIAQICLTPWESKRLIAKGVTQLDSVKKALTDGIISIARGTTNGYVVEELLGISFEKERFVAGGIGPNRLCIADLSIAKPEIAVVNGQLQEVPTAEIIQEMGAGDVFNAAMVYALSAGQEVGDALPAAVALASLQCTREGLELVNA